MKVFVMNSKKLSFLTSKNRWSAKTDSARNFLKISSAVEFCASKKLEGVYVLLIFPDMRDNVHIGPLPLATWTPAP
jgi:hypothetical protein